MSVLAPRRGHCGELSALLSGIQQKRTRANEKNDGSDLEIVADAAASYSEIDSEPQ
jgi:hypothetical protein